MKVYAAKAPGVAQIMRKTTPLLPRTDTDGEKKAGAERRLCFRKIASEQRGLREACTVNPGNHRSFPLAKHA